MPEYTGDLHSFLVAVAPGVLLQYVEGGEEGRRTSTATFF